MTLRNLILAVALLLSLRTANTLADDKIGYTRDEWAKIYRNVVETSINTQFIMLAKNYADVAISLEAQMDQDLVLLKMVVTQLRGIEATLPNAEGEDIPGLLRDARLLYQAARALAAQVSQYQNYLNRIVSSYSLACEVDDIRRFSEAFSVSGAAQTKGEIEKINEQIAKVAREGIHGFQLNYAHNQATRETRASAGPMGPGETQAMIITCFTAAGAAVGSVLPVIGTAIGGLIGSVVGTIFCGIFFKSPTVALIEKLQEQIVFIVESVDGMAREGAGSMASASCGRYVKSEPLRLLISSIAEKSGERGAAVQSELAAVKLTAATIQSLHKERVEFSQLELYSRVQKFADASFETYFKDAKAKSLASQEFAEARIAPPLQVLLDSKSRPAEVANAELQLWEALIEGDTSYSSSASFSFDTRAGPSLGEVVAWDAITKAVFETVEGLRNPGARP